MAAPRPRIGVTLDLDEARGRFEVPRAYADAVLAAGGLPVGLAPLPATAAELFPLLDGLLVTGGAFDVPPELYGEARRAACGPSKPERSAFELALLRLALSERRPVLGVCGGMQLLAVARGGTLYQDLAEDAGLHGHEQPPPKDAPSHEVEVAPGTLLAALVGAGPLAVNSTHHQAVRVPGTGVLVSARAPDGVAEGIEVNDHPFAVGVQWHPEAVVRHEPRHAGVYAGLVAAALKARGG